MTASDPGVDADHAARRATVRGAGSVALSRLGTVIDLVSQPAYTWLYGLATYGLYQVLWSLVNLLENVFDLGVTSGLQRVLPQAQGAERARVVRAALILGVAPCVAVAGLVALAAPLIAPHLNVEAADQGRLLTAVRLFAWALPLWAAVEVVTACLRACQAFGPEIRIRLMWEQIARLILSVLLWLAGVDTLGLLLAHLGSLSITVARALRLLDRYVPLGAVWRARLDRATVTDLFWSSTAALPPNILGRLFTDLPTVLANLMVPGAGGAAAAGLYAIARKVASIPLIVRQTFGYVLAPITAAAVRGERGTVQTLYAFAVRISTVLALPTAAALIAMGGALLALFAHGSEAALPILVILTAARGLEAMLGPASAIQQVVARRSLPAINSLVGLAIAAAVLLATQGPLGVLGIAVAVGVGQVIIAALSVFQLRRTERLHAFASPYGRAFLTAAAACCGLFAVGWFATALPDAAHAAVVLAAWAGALWLAARFGLDAHDKAALGKGARRLRL